MITENVDQQIKSIATAINATPALEQFGQVRENNLVLRHKTTGVEAVVTVTPTRYVLRCPRPNRYTGSFSNPRKCVDDFVRFVEHHNRG